MRRVSLPMLESLHQRAFADEAGAGGFTFVFVGDLPPDEELQPLLQQTFGALLSGGVAAGESNRPPWISTSNGVGSASGLATGTTTAIGARLDAARHHGAASIDTPVGRPPPRLPTPRLPTPLPVDFPTGVSHHRLPLRIAGSVKSTVIICFHVGEWAAEQVAIHLLSPSPPLLSSPPHLPSSSPPLLLTPLLLTSPPLLTLHLRISSSPHLLTPHLPTSATPHRLTSASPHLLNFHCLPHVCSPFSLTEH
jgi:hypothetical protein